MNKQRLFCPAFLVVLVSVVVVARARPSDAVASAPLGDAIRGKNVFERRCTGCHALDRNDEGPRLGGVYGRTSGTVSRFPYSEALQRAHIVWDDKSLERWLAGPDIFVPGSGMPVYVPKPEERRDLIAYLKANSKK
jgi:cytochrome c